MKRLFACAGITLAVSVVSIDADTIRARDIVTLAPSTYAYTEGCPSQVWTHLDQVINPNASRSPFVIPAGSVFVLTGASVARSASGGNGLDIRIRNVVTEDVELVAVVPAPNLAPTYGIAALMFTPGVVVGHDTTICTSVSTPDGVTGAGSGVRLYGYLEKVGKIEPHGPIVIRR